ncbi:hypothetical protein O6P43_014134 [Quillaja saponaria]|uniref:Uncharacterized protein n=1 Tax=Quillaja saponaria TaxID=32244 RepID=A0AAD7LU79_QUISA|nr:hypothetical protein O6P43_014134 [Quillaja saponaria]
MVCRKVPLFIILSLKSHLDVTWKLSAIHSAVGTPLLAVSLAVPALPSPVLAVSLLSCCCVLGLLAWASSLAGFFLVA